MRVAGKAKSPLSIAKQVLDIELAGLKAVRAQLDGQFTAAVEAMVEALGRRNKLVIVGIGKSGNIGQKIAATFNSTGATSVLLDAVNALHGDIGLLDDGDVVLALSGRVGLRRTVRLRLRRSVRLRHRSVLRRQ